MEHKFVLLKTRFQVKTRRNSLKCVKTGKKKLITRLLKRVNQEYDNVVIEGKAIA